MRRSSVTFEVANCHDLALVQRGLLDPLQVRRNLIAGVVDPAVARLVLPQAVVQHLGVPVMDRVMVRYANGRTARRPQADGVSVTLLGRRGVYSAIVEPRREFAMVGFIVLVVDREQRRIRPRDPRGKICEIE